MSDEAKALVEECRLDAKAFRENTVYDSDGDPIRLIANADRLDQYADLIETQAREIERLNEAMREAFKQEVSDAVEDAVALIENEEPYNASDLLACFIIAKPVDPLVEALGDADLCAMMGHTKADYARDLRTAMQARGYEWRKIGEGA